MAPVRTIARGTFEIQMSPSSPELSGAVARFDFTKTFRGDLEAVGAGVMLSAGDPTQGAAGYVAIETVSGCLGGQTGEFVMQQLGSMFGGSQVLQYEVVPGSGRGELEGMTGALHLTVDEDGTHRYELEYSI